jgi:hypothetical protein
MVALRWLEFEGVIRISGFGIVAGLLQWPCSRGHPSAWHEDYSHPWWLYVPQHQDRTHLTFICNDESDSCVTMYSTLLEVVF